jgi:hypothetical protein
MRVGVLTSGERRMGCKLRCRRRVSLVPYVSTAKAFGPDPGVAEPNSRLALHSLRLSPVDKTTSHQIGTFD